MLECWEGVIHQLILKRVNQASQETVLSLGVGVDIFRSIARQLQESISVLTDEHGSLLQCQDLLFLHYHQALWNMVPEGLMIVKKEEFLALKQGPMSVSEYRDKFLQLSRYAPEDVNTDAKRQYRFMRGLTDESHLPHLPAPDRQGSYD